MNRRREPRNRGMAQQSKEKFLVLDLLQLDVRENDALDLKCIGGRPGLIREIAVTEINRPGLELGGFYENFAFQRIQIFGRGKTPSSRSSPRKSGARSWRSSSRTPSPAASSPIPSPRRRTSPRSRRRGNAPSSRPTSPPPSSRCASSACSRPSSRPRR